MMYDSRPKALAQATGIVYHCIMRVKETAGPGFYMHWMGWHTREYRIEKFRTQHGIPSNIPDEIVVQAIVEDWQDI